MKKSVKPYLVAYNIVAFLFWLVYLACYLNPGFGISNEQQLLLLNIAQGLAVLEIVHAALKFVNSPVVSTAAQVVSRLIVLVLINLFYKSELTDGYVYTGIVVVSFAWSITEIVRYSFYALQLLGNVPKFLVWCRYSLFIVLYPIGVIGEWLIIASPIIKEGIKLDAYNAMCAVLLVSYIYYFPVLYGYMWKQRRKKKI